MPAVKVIITHKSGQLFVNLFQSYKGLCKPAQVKLIPNGLIKSLSIAVRPRMSYLSNRMLYAMSPESSCERTFAIFKPWIKEFTPLISQDSSYFVMWRIFKDMIYKEVYGIIGSFITIDICPPIA